MEPWTDISIRPDGFNAPRLMPQALPHTPSRANDFYELTKPRLNFMVLITTMVGYYMAARSSADWSWLTLHTLLGTALTAAGSGVLNQYIDREHDKLMPRTRLRALPDGRVTPAEALIYGCALAIVGILY